MRPGLLYRITLSLKGLVYNDDVYFVTKETVFDVIYIYSFVKSHLIPLKKSFYISGGVMGGVGLGAGI